MNLIENYEEQINSLVNDDEDLAAYVERLETMTDNGMSLDDEAMLDLDWVAASITPHLKKVALASSRPAPRLVR